MWICISGSRIRQVISYKDDADLYTDYTLNVSFIVRIIHFSSSHFRSKNTVNILIKNMLDALLGGLTYWMIGWGVAYGTGCTNGVCTNGFIGSANYFSYNMDSGNYPAWFFQFVFAATAATIVSGAIAERCQFFAYFVYSIVITGTPLGLVLLQIYFLLNTAQSYLS